MKNILLCFCLGAFLSCSREAADSATLSSGPATKVTKKITILEFDNQAASYILNTEEANLIETPKGSRIRIPASAFINKNGDEVVGKVTIQFSEYQTNGEIIASQIPMIYTNPSGEKEQFESAGMFEIRALQKGKELLLVPGKKIEVSLKSSNVGKFNFYAFDDQKKNWVLKDTDCLPDNPKLTMDQKKLLDQFKISPPEKPRKPIAYKNGDELFDINVNPQNFPEFKSINGVMWKYLGEDDKKSPTKNPDWFKKKYKYVMMEELSGEDLAYNITFMSANDTLIFEAAPVFQGRLLTRKSDEYQSKIKDFNKQIAEAKKLREQQAREDKLLRTFKIDQLGIYNYDRQFKDEQVIPILASFEFGSGISADKNTYMHVYLIPAQKNVVIKYAQEQFHLFAINPQEDNKIIAISAENEMFYLSNNDIRKLKIDQSIANARYTFHLKHFEKKGNESKHIDELLSQL